jgi:hypothetical protein
VTVSLVQFLRTGNLGELRPGLTPEEVRHLMGEPEDTGGTSRRYRRPSIWLYGDVELHFRPEPPHACGMLFIEPHFGRHRLRLPTGWEADDWALDFGTPRAEVEAYLRVHELSFGARHVGPVTPSQIAILSSGVTLSFDEEGTLWALASVAP